MVTFAPCATRERVTAAPIPRAPPVTTACLPDSACDICSMYLLDLQHQLRAGQVPFQLFFSTQILLGPGDISEPLLGRFMQCPCGIGQMRPRHSTEVGAPRRYDRIHMIAFKNI